MERIMTKKELIRVEEMLGTFDLLLSVVAHDAQGYLDAGKVDFTEVLKRIRAARKSLHNVPVPVSKSQVKRKAAGRGKK
jgi:hypothetical protein